MLQESVPRYEVPLQQPPKILSFVNGAPVFVGLTYVAYSCRTAPAEWSRAKPWGHMNFYTLIEFPYLMKGRFDLGVSTSTYIVVVVTVGIIASCLFSLQCWLRAFPFTASPMVNNAGGQSLSLSSSLVISWLRWSSRCSCLFSLQCWLRTIPFTTSPMVNNAGGQRPSLSSSLIISWLRWSSPSQSLDDWAKFVGTMLWYLPSLLSNNACPGENAISRVNGFGWLVIWCGVNVLIGGVIVLLQSDPLIPMSNAGCELWVHVDPHIPRDGQTIHKSSSCTRQHHLNVAQESL